MTISKRISITKTGPASLGVIIPKVVTEVLSLDSTDKFDLTFDVKDEVITMRKVKKWK